MEESGAKVEALGVKAEAMDIDGTGDGAVSGAGAAALDGAGKGPGAEEWRWRIMSLTILPGRDHRHALPPCLYVSQLSKAFSQCCAHAFTLCPVWDFNNI